MTVTLILPAKDIPDGYSVRKPTGATFYTLKKKITIYGEDKREVFADGIEYLVGEHINAIKSETNLALDMEIDEAIDLLQEAQHKLRHGNK